MRFAVEVLDIVGAACTSLLAGASAWYAYRAHRTLVGGTKATDEEEAPRGTPGGL